MYCVMRASAPSLHNVYRRYDNTLSSALSVLICVHEDVRRVYYETETIVASSECTQIKTHKACLVCHNCFIAAHMVS